MKKFGTLSDAIDLAEFAHKGQFDKAGLPYIEHPKRVLATLQAQGALPYVQIAGILHDVTEDTAFTPRMLLELGFSEASVEVIRLVDRHESAGSFSTDPIWQSGGQWAGITEADYYYERIRENVGAYKVKKADINDNLQDWRIVYLPEDTQKRLRKKYAHAIRVLEYGARETAHREKFLYE